MTELENLNAKSHEDLEAIAVAFGDFSIEEAKQKTKEELISAIVGVKAPEAPAKAKKAPAKKKAAPKKAKSEAKAEEVKSEEPKEEVKAEKPAKASKTPRKTKAKKEEAVPAPVEAPVAEVEVKAEEEKPAKKAAPKKRTKKAKAEETVQAEITDVVAEAPAEEVPSEEKKPETKKRGRKTKVKKEETVEAVSEEVKTESAPVATETEAVPEKRTRSKKRSFQFGADKGVVEVPVDETAEAETETTPVEEVVVPEIQYIEVEGVLSIGGDKGDYCGFVHRKNYLPGEEDAYVPGQLIKRMGLRKGDYIKGLATQPRAKDKYAPLKKVLEVNGVEIPEDSDYSILRKRPRFENLTAIYPNERLTLETNKEDLSCRIIDLFSPIGKGQRGMIVSPPKAGKTILLQKVANSITANNPSCKLIVLLIDERPEEVTDMQRSIKGEVVYSTFDKRPENHVRVTELVLERAMRLVELGEDVVILLDSMTRLARAYNLTINPTGRTLSGGLDPGSLYGPKRFFGAARNIEDGGSLTIISTALIETGSRMDEVIFEEFKGTGNMEVTLDRKLADRRVFPAIAVDKSGTRREDLLLTKEELEAVWLTRKTIADVDTIAATDAVLNFMKKTPSNASFVLSVKKSFATD